MNIITKTINHDSPFFSEVLELSKKHSTTLGFLPRGAFENFALNDQLICAFDDKKHLMGYLLFNKNKKEQLISIVHLCVAEERKGIAKCLFNELKLMTKDNYRGIRVHCRRDFEANDLWPKLGFEALGEKSGRSKRGTTLIVWWYDYGHPDLFSEIEEEKIQIAIDANIVFELQDNNSERYEETMSLNSDWLTQRFEFCITKETSNEILRNKDEESKKKTREFTSTFQKLVCSPEIFENVLDELYKLFSKPTKINDQSDYRQIAWAIAAEVSFFITLDQKLLDKGEKIYDTFGLSVIRPAQFIRDQDSIIRETEYQPSRLHGSSIDHQLVNSKQIDELDKFRDQEKEKKTVFDKNIFLYCSQTLKYEPRIVLNNNNSISIIVYNRENPEILSIPLFRVFKDKLSNTIIRFIIQDTIEISSKEDRTFTQFEDYYLTNNIKNALVEFGFFLFDNKWIKITLKSFYNIKQLSIKMNLINNQYSGKTNIILKVLEDIKTKSTKQKELLDIERMLWPAKIKDLDIPSFIIPIKPHWASELFDYTISNQNLYGSNPYLILKHENAYYRSCKTKVLSSPARILWYVSSSKGKYIGQSSIRACSFLDEIIIDKPKSVYNRFRRLGVYQWKNVIEITEGNLESYLMAFTFSRTELFENSINLNQLRNIWKEDGKNFHLQCPLRIESDRFFKLYNIGTRAKKIK